MNYDLIETGMRIAEVRKQSGLTQEQFGEMVNASLVHIANIEKGRKGASVELLVDVACKFNVSLDFLILGKKEYGPGIDKIKIRNAITCLMEIEKSL